MKKPKKEHKTKSGWRRIRRSICQKPNCQFFGKDAEQGHCFSINDDVTIQYIKSAGKIGQKALDELKSLRKVNKWESSAAWIRKLENAYVVHWMNEIFTLDSLVHLRAENAKLKNRIRRLRDGVS